MDEELKIVSSAKDLGVTFSKDFKSTLVLTDLSVRSAAVPILLYAVLVNFLFFRILLFFGFLLLLGSRDGYQFSF